MMRKEAEIGLLGEKSDLCDPKVFGCIFKEHYAELALFANRFLNDLHLSEEVVSDTFTALWEKRHYIELNTSVRSYLYKAVQNRCLNHLKHKKIENEYVSYLQRNNLSMATSYLAEDHYSAKELEGRVKKAVEDLPERCKQIFKLSRYKSLKNREIAELLELSPKTVERQITIALERLRNTLLNWIFIPMSFLFY